MHWATDSFVQDSEKRSLTFQWGSPRAEGQGPYSLSQNVFVHLCPTGGGWHPMRASATCACASLVYTQASALAVLKGSLRATTDRGRNNVLAVSANNLS